MYTIDFETYSEAGYLLTWKNDKPTVVSVGTGGLGEVGVYPYVEHPSFEVLCLFYDNGTGSPRSWWPGRQPPTELLHHVNAGGLVEAHNAGGFEYVVWNRYCVKAFSWPVLRLERLRCSMAKCRRYSLPGALGNAAKVLGTAQKDKAGDTLIRKLCRPHTPTKKRPAVRWTRETAWEDFQALYKYCRVDVLAESDLSRHVPDLTPRELETWIVDQKINHRGVQIDLDSLNACARLLDTSIATYTAEFKVVTNGEVRTVNENAKFRDWLLSQGVSTDSVDRASVGQLLQAPSLPPNVRRALEIRQILGGANSKKLYKLLRQVSKDGRLRTQYQYCGADRTGRWASVGVQLQNLASAGPDNKLCALCGRIVGAAAKICECEWPGFKDRPGWDIDAMERALLDIRSRPYEKIVKVWGDPGALLAGCLRGLLVSKPGHNLISVDFSAIEAVALACLSRCAWRVDVFNTHGKIYETTAAKISGLSLEEILSYKKEHGAHHPYRKKLGKIPELASGYGGWINAWKAFGADKFFASDDEIKAAVKAWRADSPEIVEFWGGQHRQVGAKPWESVPELYGLEGTAVRALQNPGQCFSYLDIGFGFDRDRDVLFCRLPSGRFLHYHKPRLTMAEDYFRRPIHRIIFYGWNSNPNKGGAGWIEMETYGGRLAENVTQAVSADIQAEALIRAENAGYPVVMHTHDEITAEVPEGDTERTLEGLTALMMVRPSWASWWPIRAAGWIGKRYRKD